MTAIPPQVPIAALALAALGVTVGATFPIVVIFSMGDIAGGLSASADDASWITTLYNVGQLIGQPLLMILAGGLGRGRTMRIAGMGFALASLAVAVAPSLPFAIASRLVQGIFGGMLPTLMMLLVMTSPLKGRRQVAGLATFAIAASLGVGFAAIIGGTLLGVGGWRALFWSQALLGAAYGALASQVLKGERGDPARLRTADWPNFILLSASLGLLAIVLGEGERRFWFETWWISAALAGGLMGLGFSICGLLTAANPLLRLQVFAKPTFSFAIGLQLLFRVGLMTAIAIGPQFLARLAGYRIEQLAPALLPVALVTLATAPLAWWLSVRIDARIVLSIGLGGFALAAALCSRLSPDWAAPQFLVPMILIGVGQALFGVATLRFAVFDIAPAMEGPTIGIVFNFARIFGLIGGLALAAHVTAEQEKLHSARLGEHLSGLDPSLSQRLATQAGPYAAWISDPAASQAAGVANLARANAGQAFTLAYSDAFLTIAGVLVAAAILAWALPRLANLPPAPRNRPS
jgi:DHA2 family multidrug resistance protein